VFPPGRNPNGVIVPLDQRNASSPSAAVEATVGEIAQAVDTARCPSKRLRPRAGAGLVCLNDRSLPVPTPPQGEALVPIPELSKLLHHAIDMKLCGSTFYVRKLHDDLRGAIDERKNRRAS
jgi:hypothetical protein